MEEKIKQLKEEANQIQKEMQELDNAYRVRQQRLIEITGCLKFANELLSEQKETNKNE